MCDICDNFEENMMAAVAESDPEFAGAGPDGWLSWEPKLSDQQLGVFERMLTLTRQQMEHAGNGPRTFALMEIPIAPANAVLTMIRELQMWRALNRMENDRDARGFQFGEDN